MQTYVASPRRRVGGGGHRRELGDDEVQRRPDESRGRRRPSHPPGHVGPGWRRRGQPPRGRPAGARETWSPSTWAARAPTWRSFWGGDVGYNHLLRGGMGHPGGDPPSWDIHTVGAGGGSIAWVNAGGFLQVGPAERRRRPRPDLLRRGAGGRSPLTDANLVLGHLDPDYFCGGTMRLDEDLAPPGHRGDGGGPGHVAAGVRARGGGDRGREHGQRHPHGQHRPGATTPRHFALLAFGGAGPLHGAAVARKLHIPHAGGARRSRAASLPRWACCWATCGSTSSGRSRSAPTRVGPAEVAERFATIAPRRHRGVAHLQGFEGECELRYAINMRYLGQNYETEVEVPPIDAPRRRRRRRAAGAGLSGLR